MPQSSRWYLVMANLLYPAFLGNLTYAGFERALAEPRFLLTAKGGLLLALLLHYVMDYAYTVVNRRRTGYPSGKFVADLTIVASLYFAIKVSLGEAGSAWLPGTVWWMLVTKGAALAWELVDGRGEAWDRAKRLGVGMDAGFGVGYAALGLLGGGAAWLGVAVLADAAGYAVHAHLEGKWARQTEGPRRG